MLSLIVSLAGTSFAASEKVIYSFDAQNGDGYHPLTGVVVGSNGTLYGATHDGGIGPAYNCGYAGCGVAYSLTPPTVSGGIWTESTIAAFSVNADSAYLSGLVAGPNGTLFGSSLHSEILANGQPGGDDTGMVFELTPPASAGGSWTTSFPYFFNGGLHYPNALISDSKGNLYGTAATGGPQLSGGIFALTPAAVADGSWKVSNLHVFSGSPTDGAIGYQDREIPAGLLLRNGTLYGVTLNGGANDYGAVFRMTPPSGINRSWTETVLYSFTGGDDGAQPSGNLIADSNGVLYGTAGGGATSLGVVFALTPPAIAGDPWTESVLHNFMGNGDGALPQAGLVLRGGKLYGATAQAGKPGMCGPTATQGCGTVFVLSPPATPGSQWTNTTLYSFTGVNGDAAFPASGLAAGKNGVLYGTTNWGGANGIGTVYQITP